MSTLHAAWIAAQNAQDTAYLTLALIAWLLAAAWVASSIIKSRAWRDRARWAYLAQLVTLAVILARTAQQ